MNHRMFAPNILIADDHPMYLEAIQIRLSKLFPSANIVDRTSLIDALAACAEASGRGEPFDLVLLDYGMPGVEGPEGIRRFIAEAARSPVAIMSGTVTMVSAQALIRVGARGFLPKTLSKEQFSAAVHALLSGGTYLPPELLDGLMGLLDVPSSAATADDSSAAGDLLKALSPREREVLLLLSSGCSNKEIGRRLEIAEVTVKLHVRQILKRVGLRNRVEAAALATRAGFR